MNSATAETGSEARAVRIPSGPAMLDGELIIPPGALEEVARLSAGWFRQHLQPASAET